MAGLCLAQTAQSALKAGYEVYFAANAPGGLWRPDNSAPEYARMYPVTRAHGGGVQWAVDYFMANVPAQGR